MITTAVPVILSPPKGAPRSPGVHLSLIIRSIATETGILKPEWVEELSLVEVQDNEAWWNQLDPVARLRISIGLAWEAWYVPQLQGVTDHPGEMCVEGIYMTPDGESLDVVIVERNKTKHVLAIHEVKATYKSLKTVAPQRVTGNPEDPADLETQPMWMWQIMGYAKGASTTRAYLHVLFLCGDYTYPIRPQLGPLPDPSCWLIEFTEDEIETNWKLMKDYMLDFFARGGV